MRSRGVLFSMPGMQCPPRVGTCTCIGTSVKLLYQKLFAASNVSHSIFKDQVKVMFQLPRRMATS